jgi:RimJ/RimL family protein N-acetyltransferase
MGMRPYFLTSQRVAFGTWTVADLPLATSLWGDASVTQFHGGAWSSQEIEDRLALEIATQHKWRLQYWPLFLRETGVFIGCCGLHPRDPANRILELGCHLRRAFWSQNLGREAARSALDHGFETHQAKAVFASHHPMNAASRAFLQHLGFTYTHDEYYPPTDMIEPCYLLQKPQTRTPPIIRAQIRSSRMSDSQLD